LIDECYSLQNIQITVNLINRLILMKQGCIASLFLGKTTSYLVKVYMLCDFNFRHNTEPSQVGPW